MSFERRKVRVGRVVSDTMDKTVVVVVEWRRSHRLYRKSVRRKTRFKAHDENNTCKVGDLIRIAETRPLSATKRWRVTEVLDRAEIAEVQPEEIGVDQTATRGIEPEAATEVVDEAPAGDKAADREEETVASRAVEEGEETVEAEVPQVEEPKPPARGRARAKTKAAEEAPEQQAEEEQEAAADTQAIVEPETAEQAAEELEAEEEGTAADTQAVLEPEKPEQAVDQEAEAEPAPAPKRRTRARAKPEAKEEADPADSAQQEVPGAADQEESTGPETDAQADQEYGKREGNQQ
jgi:small subunit ribosomal protein S17